MGDGLFCSSKAIRVCHCWGGMVPIAGADKVLDWDGRGLQQKSVVVRILSHADVMQMAYGCY